MQKIIYTSAYERQSHISPWWVSNGMSTVCIFWKKMNHIIIGLNGVLVGYTTQMGNLYEELYGKWSGTWFHIRVTYDWEDRYKWELISNKIKWFTTEMIIKYDESTPRPSSRKITEKNSKKCEDYATIYRNYTNVNFPVNMWWLAKN